MFVWQMSVRHDVQLAVFFQMMRRCGNERKADMGVCLFAVMKGRVHNDKIEGRERGRFREVGP